LPSSAYEDGRWWDHAKEGNHINQRAWANVGWKIAGLDVDKQKIDVARKVVAGKSQEFHAADAMNFPEHSGDIVMLDVLHYFSDEDQQLLLKKIAASIAPRGIALIRLALNESNWRFTATKLEEWFVGVSRWIPMSGWNFPTRDEVLLPFSEEGLAGEVRPMWGWTPFNSHLFTFQGKGMTTGSREPGK
jgi:SAM-dependent methyltransferase